LLVKIAYSVAIAYFVTHFVNHRADNCATAMLEFLYYDNVNHRRCGIRKKPANYLDNKKIAYSGINWKFILFFVLVHHHCIVKSKSMVLCRAKLIGLNYGFFMQLTTLLYTFLNIWLNLSVFFSKQYTHRELAECYYS